jgi:hypothetical protein
MCFVAQNIKIISGFDDWWRLVEAKSAIVLLGDDGDANRCFEGTDS